jgi:hypothetical protein
MARLDEIAEGIAAALASGASPEPLPVSFWGHSSTEIAFLVRAVVAASERRGCRPARVEVSPKVAHVLQNEPGSVWNLPLSTQANDDATIAFWRFP